MEIVVRHRHYTIDNRWIVPYSPILTKMIDAHINVEYCHSVKSFKYVCKYISTGADMAVVGIGPQYNRNDEITKFQLGRYISSSEAFWMFFSFKVHDRYPSVEHLAVHLENGQRVYFRPDNVRAVAENSHNTTPTALFLLCQSDKFARTLLYAEIPTF